MIDVSQNFKLFITRTKLLTYLSQPAVEELSLSDDLTARKSFLHSSIVVLSLKTL